MAATGGTMMDFIKNILNSGGLRSTGDSLGEMMPPHLGKPDGSVETPGKIMKDKAISDCPNCIYDEQGNIVDYDNRNLKSILDKAKGAFAPGGNGEGTLSGFINRLMSPTPDAGKAAPLTGGTVNSSDLTRDPVTTSTPTQDAVPQGLMPKVEIPVPKPRPMDYSMPNALNPQQIEELRISLLTQAGQLDPNNPNGLSGRMNSPNASPEINGGMSDAQSLSDELNSNKRSVLADRRNTE